MERGVYDIPFPKDGAVVQPDALLVALVGFDEQNFRLGYGGGYYDRTLAASDPRPLTIGIGFEFMRLPSIRPLPHDIPMDVVVTEAGLFDHHSAAPPPRAA
jgi:5,10-methenyltetrahydrofolate synthetase